MSEWIDIGHGVTIRPICNPGETLPAVYGIRHSCNVEDGEAHIPLKGRGHDPERGWIVESDDPVTLAPSILCLTCGHHGFIRGGRWVPA